MSAEAATLEVVEDVHGTNRGYDRHLRAREKPCDPCREAHNAYIRQWRSTRQSPEAAKARSRYESARLRALTRLSKAHPEEYAELLRSELVTIAKERRP
jgi:hypothetical protein